MVNPPTIDNGSNRDELLAGLLEQLCEQQRQGRLPDVDDLASQYPDLAEELVQLWGTVRLAGAFGRSNGVLTIPSAKTPVQPTRVERGSLPRPFGDYELLEEIGRGGMGVVYRARQVSLDRIVALKMVLGGDLASAPDLARFRAEAESAARLEHANIVTVHQVGECDGQAFFSMQHIEGSTLGARVATGPVDPRDAARCLATLARAIHYAHQQGILHRDLKPSNVLLDRNGEPHITDFGLAKRVRGGTALTQTGAILGTPSYMPPEQAAGSRGTLGPASDVYSLGAILYELLTGRPPYQAASPVDTIMLVLEQDLLPPRLLNPKVDRELEMICQKCLQKPIDLRYASAEELAKDLEAFLDGCPVSARPDGLAFYLGRMFRDTHHAPVLENWGLLWMWHSLKILLLCLVTQGMYWAGITSHWPYLVLWGVGLIVWGTAFWQLRKRGGPVTFIERQIAHVWAAGIVGSISLFFAEWIHGLKVLTMSPGLAVFAGMVFLVKAGMLTGVFYFAAAALIVTSMFMAAFPESQLIQFGVVSAACFFFPGLKFYRQRSRSLRLAR